MVPNLLPFTEITNIVHILDSGFSDTNDPSIGLQAPSVGGANVRYISPEPVLTPREGLGSSLLLADPVGFAEPQASSGVCT
jgi:hypothetical protein